MYLCLFTALRQDRIISSQKVRKVCTSGSWSVLCFILVLSVNHKQFPSMQLPQKSKHNDSAFKKWMQILAGENSSRATTERRVRIQYFLNAEGQNTAITMRTKPMKRNWCRKQDSQRKRPGEVEHYWKFLVWIQLVFFDATIGSKNHTICKIHVSDIFPTDWAENSRSAITPCATTGSEWSEMIKLYCKIIIYEQSRR